MEKSSRRRRGRRKVDYVDVAPSTDLPPLVEGELRCLLYITVGEIVWGTTAPARPAPVSPAHIRLRWWGEATDGTFFRPQTTRDDRPVRTRCQFGIRSGPKQMAAYFHDMGSVTFDIQASPKSLPIGRVQVPGISSLSASNPIRGFFPIISSSSRKMGELHITMSFKPVRGAYDDSDTGTDGSISVRSRTTSIGGRGSRRSSRSRNSSTGSRSRSNSAGSSRSRRSNSGERRRGNPPSSNRRLRSRSRSTESKTSSASQRSRSGKVVGSPPSTSTPVNQPRNENPTPRGIDAMLEENGYDLYGCNDNAVHERIIKIKTTVSSSKPQIQHPPTDAITELLNRGKQLRDEMTRCALSSDTVFTRPVSVARHQVEEIRQPTHMPQQIHQPPKEVEHVPSQVPMKYCPTLTHPPTPAINEHRCDTDVRIVDMVLGAKGLQHDISMFSDMSSFGSTRASMVSELEDPLHDVSILNHLFYNNTVYPTTNTTTTSSQHQPHTTVTSYSNQTTTQTNHQKISVSAIHKPPTQPTTTSGHSVEKLTSLGHVHLARVVVKSLQLNFDLDSEEEGVKSRVKKTKQIKSKPIPAPAKNKKSGTFFVEYKFPKDSQRASTATAHDVTRVASRKVTPGGLVKFDQHSIFPIRFNATTVTRWMSDNLLFHIFHRKPKDKKASLIGVATIPLHVVINDTKLSYTGTINVMDHDATSKSMVGSVKVSIELTADSKDLPRQMSPAKQPSSVTTPNPYTVSKVITEERKTDEARYSPNKRGIPHEVIPVHHSLGQKVCISDNIETTYSENETAAPTTTILHLYIMLKEARDIPATRVTCGADMSRNIDPNVYLVCRAFASDEPSKTGVVWNTSNPKFDFNLVTPVKINSALFTRMKDNYVVVEVWTKVPTESNHADKLMGLAKIPLHLFYQSLKDPEIARAVLTSHYPLISMDGFTPIVDVFTGHERGKLKVLLALGTQDQICSLRKSKEQESSVPVPPDPHHLDDPTDAEDVDRNIIGPVQHSFEIKIIGIQGFKPLDNQVWGETDCFVQYDFPTQCKSPPDVGDESSSDDDQRELARMKSYRTDATLCVPDPHFHHLKSHSFHPPSSVPVQRILLSTCSGVGKHPGGGIPFEVWSRFYYPNVRDQLLASGSLPTAKLCALITMNNNRVSEQTFHIPLVFSDPEPGSSTSAGKLQVSVKYKSSVSSMNEVKPALDFGRTVKLEVGVIRASGLQYAARLAASLISDSELNYCAGVGVNTYVMMKPSFVNNETLRKTHCVSRSFAPDFNHHFELSCPLVEYRDSVSPISLASSLASGQLELELWHRPSPNDGRNAGDILLGRAKIPTQDLLTHTTGLKRWHQLTSLDPNKNNSPVNVGAIEISLSFTSRPDLELLLRAAKSVGWKPTTVSDLSRMLVADSVGVLRPVEELSIPHSVITACVTVTNAWFPTQHALAADGGLDRKAHVYLHYKFYDKDSVTSSLCSVAPHTLDSNIAMAKLAHRRSFLCKPSQPLVWFLREETLQLQVWLTYSRSEKSHRRPLDRDVLLGTAHVDLSTMLVGGLHRQQHISGLYPLFKAGVDDLGGASVRVYVSLNPGDHSKPCDFETSDDFCSISESILSESNESQPDSQPQETLVTKSNEFSFYAAVSVERAMHLPPLSPVQDDQSNKTSRFVSYQVLTGDKDTTTITCAVSSSSCPVWNDSKQVLLDRKLLDPGGGSVLFRVWDRESGNEEDVVIATDRMIGFATVDISVLSSGFGAVNGWYNLLDIHGNCQGQLKVAITPTEPLAPNQTTTHDRPTNQPLQQTPFSNSILHSVPISIPVQTPSGSMYYPGVPSSGQTVGSTCKNKENITPHPTYYDRNHNYEAPHPNITSVSALPPRTLYNHDQQQACLLGTLQKQMKELEEIKRNFSRRIPKPSFKPYISDGQPLIEPDCEPTSATNSPISSQGENTTTATMQLLQSDNVLPTPTTTSYPASKPTVHMSLFKPNKKDFDDYDEGMAVSDNEFSDVEIVCPRNLNQQSVIDLPPLGSDKDKQHEDVASFEPNEEEDLRRSNTGDDLDDTSLWLSRSASRMDEEHGLDEEDGLDGSYSRDPVQHEETILRIHKDDVIPIDPFIHEKDDEKDEASETLNEEDVDVVHDDHDALLPPHPPQEDVKAQDHDLENISEKSDVIDESSEVPTVSQQDDDEVAPDIQEEEEQKIEEEKEEEHLSSSSEDTILEIVADPGISIEIESPVPFQSHLILSPRRVASPTIPPPDHSEDTKSSDEDPCPPASSGPILDQKNLPNFFPPSMDLIKSMRALQAITTEQKHNLTKKHSSANEETNSDPQGQETSPASRITRKKLMKPPTFSEEQTNRLAKIFNSKFASG
nr:C2 domain-containing protein 3 isoform X1 [Ciona intestinalis]|eukprot:XP_018673314.1 C2 domain-containing protein 3 isoform X1 [Ciona intestinalis]